MTELTRSTFKVSCWFDCKIYCLHESPFLLHHQVLHLTSSSLNTHSVDIPAWSLLVDPIHVSWEETRATVEGRRDQPSSTAQRYTKCLKCCKLRCLTSPLHHCCSVCYIILSSTRWWCMFVLHCNQ